MSETQTTATAMDAGGTSLKTTLALMALVVVVGGIVWLMEGEVATTDLQELNKTKLFNHLDAKDVLRVSIDRGTGSPLTIERATPEADWRITSPLEDAADSDAVLRLLNNLTFAEFQRRLVGAEAEAYDFGPVWLTVELTRVAGKAPFRLEIGERVADGTHPVRRAQREGVFVVRKSLIEANFSDELWSYRSKVLLTARPAQVEVTRADGDALTLVMHDKFWRLDDAGGEFADPEPCQALLEHLGKLAPKAAVHDAPTPEDLANCDLSPPLVSIRLTPPEDAGGAKAAQTLELGGFVPDTDGLRYGRVSTRPFVFQLGVVELQAHLDEFTRREDYRSLALFPLAGGTATVTGIGAKFAEGPEWRIQRPREGGDWIFEGPGDVRVEEGVKADMVEQLVELELLELLPADSDPATLGLEPTPRLQIEVVEGDLRREVHVGHEVAGQAGVFNVRRVGEERIYTAELGALPDTLRAGRLDLIKRRIFSATHWDARQVELTKGDDVRLRAERDDGDSPWRVELASQEGRKQDPNRFKEFSEVFDQVHTDVYLALDSEESRALYGLDDPLVLVVMVEEFEELDKVQRPRTLWLGRREGDRVFALNPDGPPAIGRVEARILDRIERGFAKGQKILSVDRYQAIELSYRRGADEVIKLTRPDLESNWRWADMPMPGEFNATLEDLLTSFEAVEVTDPQKRPDAAFLAEKGLEPPQETITLVEQRFGAQGPNATRRYTIRIGAAAGPSERWAIAQEGDELSDTAGRLFDALRAQLDAFAKKHAPATPFEKD